MAKEAQATGYIKAGRLTIRTEYWPLSDGEVAVTVRKHHATRSVQQNRWYWGSVVGLVADHTGYTPEEIHEIYKAKFLPRVMEIPGTSGEVVAEFTIGGSTTQMNKLEFGEYCEHIREWAASELGVNIPDPDPELRT
jgi:hypothetical protein